MLRITAVLVFSAAAAAAQVSSSPTRVSPSPSRVPGMHSGNIVYPGTPNRSNPGRISSPGLPSAPPRPGNILTPGTPPPRPEPEIPPARVGEPADRSRDHGRERPRRRARPVVYVPFYYPVYGYDSFGYDAPNVITVGPGSTARSSSSRVVTVGPDPDGRTIATDRDEPQAEPGEEVYFLIALRGGLIYAVSTYQVAGGTLDAVTLQGERYILPMAEVDLGFTRQLNADRGVEIDLDPR